MMVRPTKSTGSIAVFTRSATRWRVASTVRSPTKNWDNAAKLSPRGDEDGTVGFPDLGASARPCGVKDEGRLRCVEATTPAHDGAELEPRSRITPSSVHHSVLALAVAARHRYGRQ